MVDETALIVDEEIKQIHREELENEICIVQGLINKQKELNDELPNSEVKTKMQGFISELEKLQDWNIEILEAEDF